MCGFRSPTSSARQAGPFFFIWFFFIFTVKHVHTGGQPTFCWRPLCKHCFLCIIRSSSRSPSDLANFQSQVWLAVFLFSLFKPFPSSAPPRACLYFTPATFHRWPEGGEGRWQGSLHHKTPAGHCPRQLPRGITASLSASKWTGPVCHVADTRKWEGGGDQKVEEEESCEAGRREQEVRYVSRKENAWWGPVLAPRVYIAAILTRKCLTFVFPWPRLYLLEHEKNCKKSKVGPAWWMSHWSLPPQSLRLYHRGLTFLLSCDCTESHIRRGSFMKKEKKKKLTNTWCPLMVQRRTRALRVYCSHALVFS